MSTRQNRRSLSSGKALPPPHKNRPALANVTNNQTQLSHIPANTSILPSSNMAQCLAKIANVKKQSSGSTLPTSSNVKPSVVAIGKITRFATSDETLSRTIVPPVSCCMDISPNQSDGLSVSLGETMSTCDSLKSPEVEYIDDNVAEAINSIEREICSKVFISEHEEAEGNMLKGDIIANMGTTDKVVDVDENLKDPPFCATMVCDIFKHLQASEVKKRPSTDFMDWVQKDIDVSMRAILVDWLVEVAEEYRLVPDTLYLTVNYLDRYLSGNVMDRQQLQLLGVACMMIAAKYEEICPPEVVEFCYITDNTYSKEEVLQMESSVLNYLKFEMTAPTTKCFLRRFVCAAQGVTEAPSFQLECLANYLAELSLLEYSMLRFAPSQVAASAIFLANYMLLPAKRPWNLTLRHYTLYQPFDLCDCVKALHSLCCNRHHSSLPAIRVKYSQHKYKFVAKKYCPPSIPPEFFQNLNS